MWYKNVGSGTTFFRFVTNHAFGRQTDGRTDGRTDRQTAFSWLSRSAVKTMPLSSSELNLVKSLLRSTFLIVRRYESDTLTTEAPSVTLLSSSRQKAINGVLERLREYGDGVQGTCRHVQNSVDMWNSCWSNDIHAQH